VFGAAATLACSDRDDDDQDQETATETEAATATPTPTATIQPGTELAEALAQSPAYFIYTVGSGDTIDSLADMFDGVVDGKDEAFAEELREVNELTASSSLPVGYELAIPLRLPDPVSIFQANSIAASVTAPEQPGLVFLAPGLALTEAVRGQVTLYRLELENGDAPGEGRGFIATYASTDRVAIKGGELDRETRITGIAFITAGGSMMTRFNEENPLAYVYRRGTIPYGVMVVGMGLPPAESIAAGLSSPP
jgi:hypothetical protein